MLATLKNFAPLLIYALGFVLFLMSLTGKNRWTLMFVIALIPLRNIIERLHTMPYGKDFLDFLLITLVIGWFISAASQKHKMVDPSPINKIALATIFYTMFSVVHGSMYLGLVDYFQISDPRVQSWKNFCTPLLLYFITFNSVRDRKWVWRTVLVVCGTMLFMDAYLLRQITWYTNIVSRTKIHGTFVYLGPNEIAAFLNQYTIILLGIYFFMRRSLLKWGLLWLIYLNTTGILFLFSRAAYIGLAVGMFFLFLMKARKFLLPLVLVLLFWQAVLPVKVIERIEMTTNKYNELDTSSQKRLTMWAQGMELFNENPLLGIGYGGFQQMSFELGDTHNIYVKILAEQGIIGMLLFALLLITFFTQGIRLFRYGEDDMAKGLGLGFAVSIIVLAINNIFGNRWTYMEVSTFLWVFAALVARLNIMTVADEKDTLAGKKRKKNIHGKFVT